MAWICKQILRLLFSKFWIRLRISIFFITYLLPLLSSLIYYLYYLLFEVSRNVLLDIWGFDENAVDILQNMKPLNEDLNQKYAILFENSDFMNETETEVSELRIYEWFKIILDKWMIDYRSIVNAFPFV